MPDMTPGGSVARHHSLNLCSGASSQVFPAQVLNFQGFTLQRLCLWKGANFGRIIPAANGERNPKNKRICREHADVRKLDPVGGKSGGAVGRRTGGRLRLRTRPSTSDQPAVPPRTRRRRQEPSRLRPARRCHRSARRICKWHCSRREISSRCFFPTATAKN